MDYPLLVAAVDCLTKFVEHLKNELLVEQFVFPISLDPLEKVPSLAVLHHDEQLLCLLDVDGVVDLHHVLVIDCGLNLNLEWAENDYREYGSC